jgi:hypothetical protein
MSLPAFSSSYVTDGQLFRRKHGYTLSVNANALSVIDIIVPYALCKLDSVELINCDSGDVVNFKILDDDLGTVTTIPKQEINQYGFDTRMAGGFYKDQSRYEANLVQGLYLRVEYQETKNIAKDIYINIDFHEVIR